MYAYDGDGAKVWEAQQVGATTPVTTVFLGAVEITLSPTARITRTYYLVHGQRIALREQRGEGMVVYFLHGDALGSASLVTGLTGTVLSSRRYTPYGLPRSEAGSLPTPYRYTGQRDTGVGFYDYQARLYDPAVGRFVSADSIVPEPGNPQSLNRYAYVRNNPLKYKDPSGNCEVCDKVKNWLQVQYDKAQEWWSWHDPCGLSVDPACRIVTTMHSPSPSEQVQRILGATGNSADPRTMKALQWSEQLVPLISQFRSVWGPNRPIGSNEAIPLTEDQGLQISSVGMFENVTLGQRGDSETKYLWTIDEQGVKIALEKTPFDTDRGNIVHTNLSPEGAFFAGEAWFVSDNEIVINAGSGRYGYSRDNPAESARRYELAIRTFEALGYKVIAVPLDKR